MHGGVNHRAFAVYPQMAGRFRGGNALGQGQIFTVPAVNVHMVQAVGRRHKPFHVRRKTQVVRVQDIAHRALNVTRFRVDEGQ